MIKLYQNQWHGIKFSSFSKCDSKNIPSKEFYDKFYKNFFYKFKCFNDLDKDWISYKNKIASIILKEINTKKNILSIGCGIGVVEKYLVENLSNINLTAIEPSSNVSRWIKHLDRINIKDGYFPEILNDKSKFDIAYANGIDYVFDKKEYEKFLKSVVDYGVKELIIVSASYYSPSFKIHIKEMIKNLLIRINLYKEQQFWGYMRSFKEQFSSMKKAGFNSISLIYKSDNTIIIKAGI